ncbi:MAG: TIGR03668 family PPOX class F420-dependent oxidoreductase [Candidatus Rokubacteria bacterium]|nr:TIGR03668 family PPOX class F420-dependent oxidoreductase [Candidatus Rokubacteria bacterium]MBI3826086.1 TIGR03668 family PPOX class F420-dependent oxidoreductase [Candidatus Rokubacteria bacterium]
MLRHGRVARLATADVGGQPLVVPVCYALLDGLVYSAVDAKPKRTRSLRRLANVAVNPRVSLVVDHYDEDWTRLRWVMAEGVATVLTGGDDFARGIDALAAKYPQYLTLGLSRDSGAVIRIAPTRILSWRWSES